MASPRLHAVGWPGCWMCSARAAAHLPQDTASTEGITEVPQVKWPCKVLGLLGDDQAAPPDIWEGRFPLSQVNAPKATKRHWFCSESEQKKLKTRKYLQQAPCSCKGEGESPQSDSFPAGSMRWWCLCKGQALPSAARPRPARLQTPHGSCLGREWPGTARSGPWEPA